MVPWSAVEEVKSYIHKKTGFDDAEEDIMQKLTNNVSYQDSPFIKHPVSFNRIYYFIFRNIWKNFNPRVKIKSRQIKYKVARSRRSIWHIG